MTYVCQSSNVFSFLYRSTFLLSFDWFLLSIFIYFLYKSVRSLYIITYHFPFRIIIILFFQSYYYLSICLRSISFNSTAQQYYYWIAKRFSCAVVRFLFAVEIMKSNKINGAENSHLRCYLNICNLFFLFTMTLRTSCTVRSPSDTT